MARHLLQARVSEEAKAGWDAFADEHGLTVTSLAEVFGLWLASVGPTSALKEAELVTQARQVVSARRRP